VRGRSSWPIGHFFICFPGLKLPGLAHAYSQQKPPSQSTKTSTAEIITKSRTSRRLIPGSRIRSRIRQGIALLQIDGIVSVTQMMSDWFGGLDRPTNNTEKQRRHSSREKRISGNAIFNLHMNFPFLRSDCLSSPQYKRKGWKEFQLFDENLEIGIPEVLATNPTLE
jgi:hypothetical protein